MTSEHAWSTVSEGMRRGTTPPPIVNSTHSMQKNPIGCEGAFRHSHALNDSSDAMRPCGRGLERLSRVYGDADVDTCGRLASATTEKAVTKADHA